MPVTEEHKFRSVAEPSVADCGTRHECGSVESLGRVCEVTQKCKAASAWKEAARMVELEREKNQLEDDLLTFLGKIDRVQKKIDEMTLNENHDAELIAKVVKERDRVLAEKEQLSEENRKLKQPVGASKRIEQKVRDEKKAALKAKTLEFHQELNWKLEQKDENRIRLESEKKSLQREVQLCKQEIEERKTKDFLDAALIDEIRDQSAQQIADLTAENTRLKVCAESLTAEQDRVRVRFMRLSNKITSCRIS